MCRSVCLGALDGRCSLLFLAKTSTRSVELRILIRKCFVTDIDFMLCICQDTMLGPAFRMPQHRPMAATSRATAYTAHERTLSPKSERAIPCQPARF